jgi:hypothetical protein
VTELVEAGEPCQPRHTLVPVGDDGQYLLFGETPLPGVTVLPVPFLRAEDESRISTALAGVAGVANAAAQTAAGLHSVQGLVRLAPETVRLLQAGATPLTSGGANLGVLTQGSKIVAHVRWLPAGAAGTTAVLAAVGPALALLAVQWQLTAIAKKVDRAISLTQTVLDELRAESWHELQAAAAVVVGDVRKALLVGQVTDRAFANLQSQGVEVQLRKHRGRHLDDLQRRRDEFTASSRDRARGAWLTDNYQQLLRDVQVVYGAQRSLSLYQMLRAANLRLSGDRADALWAESLTSDALAEQRECMSLLDGIVRQIDVAFSLLLEVDAERTVSLNGVKKPLTDVRGALRTWHEEAARDMVEPWARLSARELPVLKRTIALSTDDVRRYRGLLRWLVEPDEAIEVLASGTLQWEGQRTDVVLLVQTPRRLLLLDQKALREGQCLQRELPLDSAGIQGAGRIKDREQVALSFAGESGTFTVASPVERPVAPDLIAAQERGKRPDAPGELSA